MTDPRLLAPDGEPCVPDGVPPTFSVVIPAFNVAPYLRSAVSSMLAQTVAPLEVIVVDDGSTDDFDSAVAPMRDRIRVVRKPNGGEASARNAGVRVATGEFVAFLDGDDVADPHRLEALGRLAARYPGLDLLATDCSIVSEGRVTGRYFAPGSFPTTDQRCAIFGFCFLPSPAVRRERLLEIGGFDETLVSSTDWDCYIRMMLAGSRAGYVDSPLFEYRRRPGQLTEHATYDLTNVIKVLKRYVGDDRLDDAEVEALGASIRRHELLLMRAMADARRPDARDVATRMARDESQSFRARVEAALTMVSPRCSSVLRHASQSIRVGLGRLRRWGRPMTFGIVASA